MQRISVHDPETWNHYLNELPRPHILQSWEWGTFKQHYGWQAQRWLWTDDHGAPLAAAQILSRSVRIPILGKSLKVSYCPRGPLLDWGSIELGTDVLQDLKDLASHQGPIFLKIDPHIPIGSSPSEEDHQNNQNLGSRISAEMHKLGWLRSKEQIQFRNTMTLDLRSSEEQLLAGMKQKTRYNVRLASRRGVTIRQGGTQDLPLLYQMYAETSVRDGFAIREPEYYRHAWDAFIEAGLAQALIAEVDGEPAAGLILFHFGGTAWYFYGMSRGIHREKMPNYLLQWEAIRWARSQGCTTYDFWGAPDQIESGDAMWGVYRFKHGFGAELERTPGAWDYPLRKGWFWIYATAMPPILSLMRSIGRTRTRRLIE